MQYPLKPWMPHPHIPLCYSTLYKISYNEHQCVSQCWCSPTWHTTFYMCTYVCNLCLLGWLYCLPRNIFLWHCVYCEINSWLYFKLVRTDQVLYLCCLKLQVVIKANWGSGQTFIVLCIVAKNYHNIFCKQICRLHITSLDSIIPI